MNLKSKVVRETTLTQYEHICDAAELGVLLHGNEDSDEYHEVAVHVEACHSCQQSLMRLAGEQQAWSEVRELLVDYSSDVRLREFNPDQSSTDVSLDFLGAPSHPEMLDRLGRYEIERVIGSGGMGIVFKGFDSELNRPVAIKVLAPHLCSSGPAKQRFEREARAATAVVHEHIVAIHNVETDDKIPFIVMQFVPGVSLQDRVDRVGALPAKEVLRLGMQTAAGLAAAHEQGVIHRDIKPANILLKNSIERALVTDFGLARSVDDASLTHTGLISGTPHYMSPEQANADGIDHASDLFSLGSVLYFIATDRPPLRADKAMGVLHRICNEHHRPACEVNTDIPYELSDVIDCLLEKKPANRIASAAQLRVQLFAQLARLQAGRRQRRSYVVRRFFRRKWKRVIPIAGLTALSIGLWAFTTGSSTLPPDGVPDAKIRVYTPLAVSDESAAAPASQQFFSDSNYSTTTR